MRARWCEAAGGPLSVGFREHIRGIRESTPFRPTGSRYPLGKNTQNEMLRRRTADEISDSVAGSLRTDDAIRQKVMGRRVAVARSRGRSGGLGRFGLGGADAALALLDEPAGDHGVGVFVEPLIEEGRDLLAEIGGVAEAGQFITLQGVLGSGEEELPRRLGTLVVHGISSMVVVTYCSGTVALRIL